MRRRQGTTAIAEGVEELRSELLDAMDSREEAIVALVDKVNEISLAGHDPTRMGVTSGMRELEKLVSIGVE